MSKPLVLILLSLLAVICNSCTSADEPDIELEFLNLPFYTYHMSNDPETQYDEGIFGKGDTLVLLRVNEDAHMARLQDTAEVFERNISVSSEKVDLKMTTRRGLFKKPVTIKNTVFLRDSHEDDSKSHVFQGFEEYVFQSTFTLFNNDYRLGTLRFNTIQFGDDFIIEQMETDTIDANIDFANCRFYRSLHFNQQPRFPPSKYLYYSKALSLDENTLADTIDFSYCGLIGKGEFKLRSLLPNFIDFSFSKFNSTVDLRNLRPRAFGRNKCEINLLYADIEKIQMQYSNFHLYFPENVLNSSYFNDLVSSTYESLLNNFKLNGYSDSFKQLDKEYKEWQGNYDWTLRLSDYWWKFGYEKWRIIFYSLFAILLFSFLNYWKFDKLQQVYPVDILAMRQPVGERGYIFKTSLSPCFIPGLYFSG